MNPSWLLYLVHVGRFVCSAKEGLLLSGRLKRTVLVGIGQMCVEGADVDVPANAIVKPVATNTIVLFALGTLELILLTVQSNNAIGYSLCTGGLNGAFSCSNLYISCV